MVVKDELSGSLGKRRLGSEQIRYNRRGSLIRRRFPNYLSPGRRIGHLAGKLRCFGICRRAIGLVTGAGVATPSAPVGHINTRLLSILLQGEL